MTALFDLSETRSPARTRWSNKFCMDMALLLENSGDTLSDVLDRHGYDANDMLIFRQDPTFLRQVDAYRLEVREKGLTFKLKARAQAEELLLTSWQLIHDPVVSPAVKADLIKSTVKWAGLDAGPAGSGADGASGVTISINFGGQTHEVTAKTVDATPLPPMEDADVVG